jgi:DNA-binding HxlR family transcriptional regulator
MKELEGISPKTLTDTLASLQKEGFVGREAFTEIPPRGSIISPTTGRNSGMPFSHSSSGL